MCLPFVSLAHDFLDALLDFLRCANGFFLCPMSISLSCGLFFIVQEKRLVNNSCNPKEAWQDP